MSPPACRSSGAISTTVAAGRAARASRNRRSRAESRLAADGSTIQTASARPPSESMACTRRAGATWSEGGLAPRVPDRKVEDFERPASEGSAVQQALEGLRVGGLGLYPGAEGRRVADGDDTYLAGGFWRELVSPESIAVEGDRESTAELSIDKHTSK